MADRIAVMHDGRLEQYGTPAEVYDNPTNRFVASFIGSPGMNFIEGRADETGRVFVNDAGVRMALPGHYGAGRDIVLGFRPENLVLGEGGFRGSVNLVEPTGAEELVTFDVPGGRVLASLRERPGLREGQNAGLTIAPQHLHVFGGPNGERLPAVQ